MQHYIELIDKKLDEFIEIAEPKTIFEAMRYSVLAKGKRLRPILCLEACKVFGGNIENAIATACAIEMVHAQSLIHDDLPCMDNDDFRRGNPTNHKVFGEAIAVLAGDALMSLAPQVLLQKTKGIDDATKLRILEEFCTTAGAYGLIAGQVVDIESEGKIIDAETLEFIHTHKTADLFKVALKTGAMIAGANDVQIKAMEDFALNLGFAFQICDDILDEISTFEEMGKTLGKDKEAQKSTYTSLFGMEQSKCKVNCLLQESYDILSKHNIKSEIFVKIIEDIKRKANS